MPVFDGRTAIHPEGVAALRQVLGPAKRREPRLKAAAGAYRRRRHADMLKRALVVVVLIGAAAAPAMLLQ